jgi:quercetin dioxygenase-like cupin family protein
MSNVVSPPPSGGPAPARNEPERSGRVIVNPISGERIVIRQSGAETRGELFSFDLYLPPGGHVPAGHVHPVQEERFTVIEGQMRFRLGRQTILARPGETVIVPPGKAHWFGAEGAQAAHAYVEARPALRMEEFFAENETLSLSGRLGGTRLPRLTDLARILLDFQREVAVPYAPAFLVRIALTPLAWLGRRRARTQREAPQHGAG